MKELDYGKDYAYDHHTAEGFSGQNYFPDGMDREEFYRPTDRGEEARISERLARWASLRGRA
jgi:putative ATPase